MTDILCSSWLKRLPCAYDLRSDFCCFVFCFRFGLIFWDRFLYIALTVLKLALWIRLASNLQRSTCLCLLSAGIKSVHHHAWPWKWVLSGCCSSQFSATVLGHYVSLPPLTSCHASSWPSLIFLGVIFFFTSIIFVFSSMVFLSMNFFYDFFYDFL